MAYLLSLQMQIFTTLHVVLDCDVSYLGSITDRFLYEPFRISKPVLSMLQRLPAEGFQRASESLSTWDGELSNYPKVRSAISGICNLLDCRQMRRGQVYNLSLLR